LVQRSQKKQTVLPFALELRTKGFTFLQKTNRTEATNSTMPKPEFGLLLVF
jgi:hypothetical protein